MRVPDRCLVDLRQRGYLVFEGFLEADELAAAQEALWLHYPRPEEYFADPDAHAWLATDQWAGIVGGPWRSWSLNRLAFHPDLLDLVEPFPGSADLRLVEAGFARQQADLCGRYVRHVRHQQVDAAAQLRGQGRVEVALVYVATPGREVVAGAGHRG